MVWVFPFGFACLRSVAGETPWVWDVSRLLSVARDPKHLGSEIGFFTVLHTWNQKLGLHPHVHCVIPAGGLSPDHTHWVKSRERFFLPIYVLRAFSVASLLPPSDRPSVITSSSFMET